VEPIPHTARDDVILAPEFRIMEQPDQRTYREVVLSDGVSIVFERGRVDQSSLYNIDHRNRLVA
jgi:hypothetical protein